MIVFGAGGGELAEGKEECGDPELGVGAVLEGPSRSHERRVVCSEGLELEGGGSSATIRCQDGRWNSSSIHCRHPSCQTPPPLNGAKVEVVGSSAIYSCSLPGMLGNIKLWDDMQQILLNLRNCSLGSRPYLCRRAVEGKVRQTTKDYLKVSINLLPLRLPSCSPLSCGQPPSVQFASHGLSNSSFLVGELAVYTCDQGFLMVVNSSNSPVATEQVCCQVLLMFSF